MPETTAGVVVTYFPDDDFAGRLSSIAREVSPVLVVDNTDEPVAREAVRRVALQAGALWFPQPNNRGTAGALNEAFSWLVGHGHTRVIAFDQDSTPDAGLAENLLRCAGAHPTAAVIGSNWRDEARPDAPSLHLVGRRSVPWFRRVRADDDLAHVAFVITSGSYFSLEAWRAIGPFAEALFLDLVDTEYCLRAVAAGWDVVVAAGARLRHRRGAKTPVPRFGRTWWPANMPPDRIHLLIRNRTWMIKQYGSAHASWASFELAHTVFMVFSALFLEPARGVKVSAFMRGLDDGMHNRLGPPRWATAPHSGSHPNDDVRSTGLQV